MPFINTLGTFSFPGKFLTEPQIGSNFWLPIRTSATPSTLTQTATSVSGTPFMFVDNFGNTNFFTGGSISNTNAANQVQLTPRVVRISPDGVQHLTRAFVTTGNVVQIDAVYANNHFYVALVLVLPKTVSNPTRLVYDARVQIAKFSIPETGGFTLVWKADLIADDNLETNQIPTNISVGYDQLRGNVYASYQRITDTPVTHVVRESDGLVLRHYNQRFTRQVTGVVDNSVNSVYGGNLILNFNESEVITGAKSVTMTHSGTPVSDYKIFDGVAYGFHQNILFRHNPVSSTVTAFSYTLGGTALNIDNVFVAQDYVLFTSNDKVIKLDSNLNYLDGYQNTRMSSSTFYPPLVCLANGRIITLDDNDVFSIPVGMIFPGTGQYSYTYPGGGATITATLTKLGAVVRNTATISKTIQSTTAPSTINVSGWTGASLGMNLTIDQLEYKAI